MDHYFSTDPGGSGQPREIQVELGGRRLAVQTTAGIFSPDGVDKGTRVLLDHVPDPPPGDLLDLGCGWGPLSIEAALRSATHVWALDVNPRALDAVGANARRLGLTIDPVTADQLDGRSFTTIWSNPPIRIGKEALHDLLMAWLPRLTPDGTAWLVVSRNLGADSLHRWLSESFDRPVDRVASHKGFRVLMVGPTSGR